MGSRDVKPPADKHGHAAKGHPTNRGMARTPRVIRAQVQAKAVEKPDHADLNDVKKPQAKQNFQFGEVAQTKREQHKGGDDARKSRRDRNHMPAVSPGQEGEHRQVDAEPGEHVPSDDGKGQAKSPLKQAVARKGSQGAGRARDPGDFQKRGGNRERQPLVVHPLFSQQHAETQVNRQNARDQQAPPEKHGEPLAPRKRRAGHLPFVKPAHRVSVGDGRPTRHVGQEELVKPVLGRGVISGHGQHLQKPHRQPFALHGGCHKADAANRQQLRRGKPHAAPLEKRIQNQQGHKGDEHRHRQMRMIRPRGVEHKAGVRGPQGHEHAHPQADQEGSLGDNRRSLGCIRFWGLRFWLCRHGHLG